MPLGGLVPQLSFSECFPKSVVACGIVVGRREKGNQWVLRQVSAAQLQKQSAQFLLWFFLFRFKRGRFKKSTKPLRTLSLSPSNTQGVWFQSQRCWEENQIFQLSIKHVIRFSAPTSFVKTSRVVRLVFFCAIGIRLSRIKRTNYKHINYFAFIINFRWSLKRWSTIIKMVSYPRQAATPSVDDRVANQFSTLLYFLHKKKQTIW